MNINPGRQQVGCYPKKTQRSLNASCKIKYGNQAVFPPFDQAFDASPEMIQFVN